MGGGRVIGGAHCRQRLIYAWLRAVFAHGQLVRDRLWTPLNRVDDDLMMLEYFFFASPGSASEVTACAG
jgi:hypothetical protein